MFPIVYALQRLRRSGKETFVTVALCAALMLLVGFLYAMQQRQQMELISIQDTQVISCVIADAATLNTEFAAIDETILSALFSPSSPLFPCIERWAYVRKAWYDLNLSAPFQRSTLPGVLIGTQTLDAIGGAIAPAPTYFEGYDDTVWQGDAPVCLLSRTQYQKLFGEDFGVVSLKLALRDNSRLKTASVSTLSLDVIGIYSGEGDNILLPFQTLCQALHASGSSELEVERASFWIRGRHLAQFRQEAAALFDRNVSRYTVLCKDESFLRATLPLERSLQTLKHFRIPMLTCMVLAGILLALLLSRRRITEIRLLFLLGANSRFYLLEGVCEILCIITMSSMLYGVCGQFFLQGLGIFSFVEVFLLPGCLTVVYPLYLLYLVRSAPSLTKRRVLCS